MHLRCYTERDETVLRKWFLSVLKRILSLQYVVVTLIVTGNKKPSFRGLVVKIFSVEVVEGRAEEAERHF